MIVIQKGRTLKSKIIDSLILSLITVVVFYFTSLSTIWILSIFICSFLFYLIFSGPNGTTKLYEGWAIYENTIKISKHTILGYKEIFININEINKIIYSQPGSRTPAYLIIHYNNRRVLLYIKYDIFVFADTLKYFKKSGIDVSLSERDAEIEMYLNGKIDKIPITNE